VAALAFAVLLAQPSTAQEGQPFKDAWFWGLKGGVLNYSSSVGTDNAGAPLVGVDWLITRTYGGLYVTVDQSFLTTKAYYKEPYVMGDPFVNVRNLRRYSLLAVAFPLQRPTLHPYVGFGASVHHVGDAVLERPVPIQALANAAQDSIQNKKVTVAPQFMVGFQKRLPRFSVFAQGTGAFVQKGFFLHYVQPKRSLEWSLEGGIRYNFGSSIDRTP
jgi:hypothetical protein